MNKDHRIGFFVRNAFQASHFRVLFDATPNAVWIGRSAKKLTSFGIDPSEPQVARRFFLRSYLAKNFDAVLTQGTLFKGTVSDRPKIVMLQYGYAKETYNFGSWRKNSHLILAYGDYAQTRFAVSAPSVSIGNPRYDDWRDQTFHAQASHRLAKYLSSNRKTIVYAPTWGDLSSLGDWMDQIADLAKTHTVLVKAHHNSVRDDQLGDMATLSNVTFLPNEDLFALLAVSDMLISDLSGAIFDGILCDKPVVLIAPDDLEQHFGKRIDETSIELSRRAELGFVVHEKSDLAAAVEKGLAEGSQVDPKLIDALFTRAGSVAENYRSAMAKLLA